MSRPNMIQMTAFALIALTAVEHSRGQPLDRPSAVPCDLALPGSLTEALVCADRAKAAERLYELDRTGVQVPAIMEVRQVWQNRESLPAESAARDVYIQTLMAHCLVLAGSGGNSQVPAELSALSFLRNAMTNPNTGVVVVAMMSLTNVLTKSDIAAIVGIASTHEDLAFPAVVTLSTSCMVEAQVGIASIQSAYSGRLRNDIDEFMAQPGVQDQPDVCSGKKTRVPQSIVAKGMNLPPGTVLRQQSSTAAQVKEALDSQDPKRVLHVLLDLSCNAENADAVGEMRRGWRDRDVPGATATVRDPVVQAVIARCLIEVDAALHLDNAEMAEATAVLRSALRSADVMGVVAAIQGLAMMNSGQDVKDIANVATRMPGMLNAVVHILGFTCGDKNLKTIAAIRSAAATQKLRDQVDAVYGHIEPLRKEKCGKSAMNTGKE